LVGNVSETINMRFKHVLGLLCAASISAALAGPAVAQDKTVKIGAVFPLSGGAASAGVHAKFAIETAMDIINNAHPELGNFPLAKNAGLAGLGGAKVEVVFADNQGSPATGQNQTLRLITEEKVVALTGAYQSDSLRQRRIGRRQSHRARLQMVLPCDAGRGGLRQDLLRFPQGHESRRGEDR
jgi:hypothetical protein